MSKQISASVPEVGLDTSSIYDHTIISCEPELLNDQSLTLSTSHESPVSISHSNHLTTHTNHHHTNTNTSTTNHDNNNNNNNNNDSTSNHRNSISTTSTNNDDIVISPQQQDDFFAAFAALSADGLAQADEINNSTMTTATATSNTTCSTSLSSQSNLLSSSLPSSPTSTSKRSPCFNTQTYDGRVSWLKYQFLNDDVDDLDEYAIRKSLCLYGVPDQPELRSLSWKVLLNYLPWNKKSTWPAVLAKNRQVYASWLKEFIVNPYDSMTTSMSPPTDKGDGSNSTNYNNNNDNHTSSSSQQTNDNNNNNTSSSSSSVSGFKQVVSLGDDPLSPFKMMKQQQASLPTTTTTNGKITVKTAESRPFINTPAVTSLNHDAAPIPPSQQAKISTSPDDVTNNNKWVQYYRDEEIREEINKDVHRTYSTLHFFQQPVHADDARIAARIEAMGPGYNDIQQSSRDTTTNTTTTATSGVSETASTSNTDNDNDDEYTNPATIFYLKKKQAEEQEMYKNKQQNEGLFGSSLYEPGTGAFGSSLHGGHGIITTLNVKVENMSSLSSSSSLHSNNNTSTSNTTVSSHRTPFYHHDALRRILFLYAKLNPGVRYVQGMNELLAPIYYILAASPDHYTTHLGLSLKQRENKDKNPSLYSNLYDFSDAEADAFFCFSNLMAELRDRFIKSLDHAENGVLSVINKLHSLLRSIDPVLWYHLDTLGIDPRFYAIRWLTLLMAQDFELPDVLRLWDALFSDSSRFELEHYICCSILITLRNELLQHDFADCLYHIQHYRATDIEHIIRMATEIRDSHKHGKFSTYIPKKHHITADAIQAKAKAQELAAQRNMQKMSHTSSSGSSSSHSTGNSSGSGSLSASATALSNNISKIWDGLFAPKTDENMGTASSSSSSRHTTSLNNRK